MDRGPDKLTCPGKDGKDNIPYYSMRMCCLTELGNEGMKKQTNIHKCHEMIK